MTYCDSSFLLALLLPGDPEERQPERLTSPSTPSASGATSL